MSKMELRRLGYTPVFSSYLFNDKIVYNKNRRASFVYVARRLFTSHAVCLRCARISDLRRQISIVRGNYELF